MKFMIRTTYNNVKLLQAIACLVLLCLASGLNAAREVRNARLTGTALVNGASLQANDDKFNGTTWWVNGFALKGSVAKVEFGLNEDLHLLHNKFCANITFDVDLTDANLVTTSYTGLQLNINYEPGASQAYTDKAQMTWNNYYKVVIKNIVVVMKDGASCTNTIAKTNDLYVETEIQSDKAYSFGPGITSFTSSDYQHSYISADNELEVHWNYLPGAEEYELEWTYVDNYVLSNLPMAKAPSLIEYDLEHDATRIVTSNQFYRIPLTYERGYIVYRIRPIGRHLNGARLEGLWTNISPRNLVSSLASGMGTSRDCYYVAAALSGERINWTSEKTFAEEGKQGVNVAYVDGLLAQRQSIVRLNAENKSMVQHDLFDFYGRKVISLIPSPINGKTFGYNFGLSKYRQSSGSTPLIFDKSVFDVCIDPCSAQTFRLDTVNSKGAANYYSSSASAADKEGFGGYTPSAHGVPYAQLKLSNDPLGRLTRSTLPGLTHSFGNGHDMQYFYPDADQAKLTRLFGPEAGVSTHFWQKITVDPNGQTCAAYMDMYGRTVATSLLGNGPASLEPLPDQTAVQTTIQNISQTNVSDPVSRCLTVSTTFFVSTIGDQQDFSYTTTMGTFMPPECDALCLDCAYDLEISITEDCTGAEMFDHDADPLTPPSKLNVQIGAQSPYQAQECNPPAGNAHVALTGYSLPGTPITITFPHIGTYTIHKKLCVSTAPLAAYEQEIRDNPLCNKAVCDVFDSLLAVTKFDGCGFSCDQCADLMLAYQNDAQSNNDPTRPPLTQEQMNEILANCSLLCPGSLSQCEIMKHSMMMDFNPGGKYAAIDPSDAMYGFSIFNPSNLLSYPGLSYAFTWQQPPVLGTLPSPPPGYSLYYKDANGNPATVQIGSQNYRPESLSQANFINRFSYSWAEAFLPAHPDYCRYTFYCEYLAGSWDYDRQMQAIDNYDDACAAGFLAPLSSPLSDGPPSGCATSNYDPLFQSPLLGLINPSYLSDFDHAMSSVNGSGNSVYMQAALSALGILGNPSALGSHHFGDDPCYKDAEWIQFRTIYLHYKNILYQQMYNDYMKERKCATTPSENSIFSFGIGELANNFGIVDEKGNAITDLAELGGATSTVNYNTSTFCAQACSGYAAMWIQNLSTYCTAYTSMSATTQNNIIRDLTAICMGGCDASHPEGSSSIDPSSSPYVIPGTSVSCTSFQDVLDYYFSASGGCSAALTISTPRPYNAPGSNLATANTLQDCGCDKVLGAEYDFNDPLYVKPAGITSARKLFKQRYGYDLASYNQIACACRSVLENSWNHTYSWTTGELNSLAAINYQVPPELTCAACISCEEVQAAVAMVAERMAYTGALDASFFATYPQLILNAVNQAGQTFDIYKIEAMYRNCISASANGNNPVIVDDLLLSPIAGEIESALAGWARGNLLTKTHPMSICRDPKYFLSNLYTGSLPGIPSLTYKGSVSGNQLMIYILDASLNTICSYELNLPPGAPFTWAQVTDIYNLRGYVANPTAGGQQNSFVVEVSNGTTSVDAICSNTCYSIFTLSPELKIMYCPQAPLVNPNQCRINIINGLLNQAGTIHQQYTNGLVANFSNEFLDYCFNALNENFTRTYKDKEYHYTLYYYDQAGSLVRTVSPKGVDVVNGSASVYPDHAKFVTATAPMDKNYVTQYSSNSFGEIIKEISPDAGESNYFYDRIGRIVASQNVHQKNRSAYSYTFYDEFGRIKEVGETVNPSPAVLTDAIAIDPVLFNAFAASGTRKEVIVTLYDDQAMAPAAFAQFSGGAPKNLRNRVCANLYYNTYTGSNNHNFGTFYSYDVHGNLIELIQQNADLAHLQFMQYKKIQYEYELISGNVNKVIYQPGQKDQFMHQYYYDVDNRIKEVYTSLDNVNWEKDAKYFYYQHGPLARVEKGDKQVDGSDYYYTLLGWLKGVNSNNLGPNTDPGKDGNSQSAYSSTISGLHSWVARDAAGYSLNYYNTLLENDYTPNKAFTAQTTGNGSVLSGNYHPVADISQISSWLASNGANLFNGNISGMVTTLTNKGQNTTAMSENALPQITSYKYDQLHRIKDMVAFHSANTIANQWNTMSGSNQDDSYKSHLNYDVNGNITAFMKKGAAPTTFASGQLNMDDMQYAYEEIANTNNPLTGKNTNRLSKVNDNVAYSGNYQDDIDNQAGTINYEYNPNGALERDPSEAISYIEWTSNQKVKKIIRDPAKLTAMNKTLPDVEFEYNAARQRVTKIVKPRDPSTKALRPQSEWTYTYYVYDSNEKILAIYTRTFKPVSGTYNYNDDVNLAELNVYGSSRLGTIGLGQNIESRPITAGLVTSNENFTFSYANTNLSYSQQILNITAVDASNPVVSPASYVAASRRLGRKQYEFSNHLSNVITTISDRKIQVPNSGNTALDYYKADVISTEDHYAFGNVMPGRSYSNGAYRYGFNGQEKINEVNGSGNFLDFKYRGYDPRLGRFMQKDPMASYLPWVTPYAFAENRPIDGLDFEGSEHMQFNYHIGKDGKVTSIDDVSSAIRDVGKKGWGIQLNFYMLDGKEEKLISTSFIQTKAPYMWSGASRPLYIYGKKVLGPTTAVNTPDAPYHSFEMGVSGTATSPINKTDFKLSMYNNGAEFSNDYKASFENSISTRIDKWGDKVSVGANVKAYAKFNVTRPNDFDPTLSFQIPLQHNFYLKITYTFSIIDGKLESHLSNVEIGIQANTNGNSPAIELNMKWFKADLKKQTFGTNPYLGPLNFQKDQGTTNKGNTSNNNSSTNTGTQDCYETH